MERIDAHDLLTIAGRDEIEAKLPSSALLWEVLNAWFKAQRDATMEADIKIVRGTESLIAEYLKVHTREGDCPCPEHQDQMKTMALEIVGIVTDAFKAQR